MSRIAGVGGYAPRYRIGADAVREAWDRFEASGVESTAVPAADEDALTMAWEASRRALDAADVDAADLRLLALATTTPPLAEEDLTPRLGEFLGVPAAATRRYHLGSTRSGTDALLAAADAEATPALVVAADCPRGEPRDGVDHAAGSGAAAFVLDPDGDAALVDRASAGADYPGTRFREIGDERTRGLGVTSYDRDAATAVVADAVDGIDDPAIDALAITATDGKRPYRVASEIGVDAGDVVTPVAQLGDLGAASAPVALARALEQDVERTLVVGWGSGAAADAVLVEGTAPTTLALALDGGHAVDYAVYLRLRGEITGEEPAGGGARVSVPSWRRSRGARYRLVAGACPECGAVQFPGEGACDDCGALDEFVPVRLARRGTVETTTTVAPGGAPPEFVVQGERGGKFGVAVVSFPVADDACEAVDGETAVDVADVGDDDATASVPVQVTGPNPDSIAAGDDVRAVVRRIYTQEGVPRYGSKVVPD